jgi:hypothetical protein
MSAAGQGRHPGGPGPVASVLLGISRLARLRADGFACFKDTPQAFLNSLAPMLAFPVVAGIGMVLGGDIGAALGDLLATLVALLAPAVLSHALAAFWGREEHWLRYAVAFNWCQAAITVLTVLVAAIAGASAAGQSGTQAVQAMLGSVVVVLLYWLVLAWFLARRGLQISGWKAVLLVLVTNFGTGLLVAGPRMLVATLP